MFSPLRCAFTALLLFLLALVTPLAHAHSAAHVISAAPHAQSAVPQAPADEKALAPVSTGEQVNGAIDNLLETGIRLLELPVFMLLAFVALLGAIAALILTLLARNASDARRARLRRALWIGQGVLLFFTAIYLVDRKLTHLQQQLNELRRQSTGNAIASLTASRPAADPAAAPASHPAAARAADPPPPATLPEKRQTFLFDAAAAQRELSASFGSSSAIAFKPVIYDAAADLVTIHASYPLLQAYLAVVDLRHPDLHIRLGGNFETKTLTSDFARENNCSIAINGEAGLSPYANSGLGNWRGYMVSMGHVLLREDPRISRPFLSFDKNNRATFTAAASTDRALPSDGYNVLWGRLDSLVNGAVQTADERNRQPRTAMAINQDGTRLYLLVVDGRQPNYSMGATRAQVGYLLKAFGAYNGMLCDEGGSSCMVLDQLGRAGGVVNIPSDNQGEERPTYTHFGISLHPGT